MTGVEREVQKLVGRLEVQFGVEPACPLEPLSLKDIYVEECNVFLGDFPSKFDCWVRCVEISQEVLQRLSRIWPDTKNVINEPAPEERLNRALGKEGGL